MASKETAETVRLPEHTMDEPGEKTSSDAKDASPNVKEEDVQHPLVRCTA